MEMTWTKTFVMIMWTAKNNNNWQNSISTI